MQCRDRWSIIIRKVSVGGQVGKDLETGGTDSCQCKLQSKLHPSREAGDSSSHLWRPLTQNSLLGYLQINLPPRSIQAGLVGESCSLVFHDGYLLVAVVGSLAMRVLGVGLWLVIWLVLYARQMRWERSRPGQEW